MGGQVGVEPPHIEIGLRQREWLRLTRLRLFLDDGDDALAVPPQQHGHRFGIGLVVERHDEADRPAASPGGMVKPLGAAHGDAVVAGQTIFPPSHDELFAPVTKKRRQVNLVGLPFLCGCEIYKFAHIPPHVKSEPHSAPLLSILLVDNEVPVCTSLFDISDISPVMCFCIHLQTGLHHT